MLHKQKNINIAVLLSILLAQIVACAPMLAETGSLGSRRYDLDTAYACIIKCRASLIQLKEGMQKADGFQVELTGKDLREAVLELDAVERIYTSYLRGDPWIRMQKPKDVAQDLMQRCQGIETLCEMVKDVLLHPERYYLIGAETI